jgi:hypothetical protein
MTPKQPVGGEDLAFSILYTIQKEQNNGSIARISEESEHFLRDGEHELEVRPSRVFLH